MIEARKLVTFTAAAGSREGAAEAQDAATRGEGSEPSPRPWEWEWEWTIIPETSATRYVTGVTSLCLRHPTIGMGGSWRNDVWGPPGMTAHTSTDDFLREGVELARRAIGSEELADLRPALRARQHPAGWRPREITAATHVRAALELGWETALDAQVRGFNSTLCNTLDQKTVRRWLSTPERTRACALGHRMLAESRCGAAMETAWRNWLSVVHPG